MFSGFLVLVKSGLQGHFLHSFTIIICMSSTYYLITAV